MSTESLSMRKTAQELGVSQLRIRELIRKGRLEAEKVPDGSGERWEISRASIDTFREERADNGPDGASGGASRGGPGSPHLATLLPELEKQLERVKTLVHEISRAQAYLDGLRRTQRRLEEEVATVRHRIEAAPGDKTRDGPTHGAGPETDPVSGKTEDPPPEGAEERDTSERREPGTESKGSRTIRKGETAVAAALRDAGAAEEGRDAEERAKTKGTTAKTKGTTKKAKGTTKKAKGTTKGKGTAKTKGTTKTKGSGSAGKSKGGSGRSKSKSSGKDEKADS